MQSLFEASMYTFVFLWTPALSPNGESIPHGFIFALFMTSSMAGSALSANLMKRYKVSQPRAQTAGPLRSCGLLSSGV